MVSSLPSARPSVKELIEDIAHQANCPDDDERILSHLRTVFRVVRARASFEQSLRFLEMLPLSLKVTFLNDWHIVPHPARPIESLDEWADEVLQHEQQHVMHDQDEARRMLRAIFTVLGRKISSDSLRRSLSFVAPEVVDQLVNPPQERYHYSDTCIWLS